MRRLLSSLHGRATGGGVSLRERYLSESVWRLELSPATIDTRRLGGALTWLALDPIECRHLLAGVGDGSIAAFDVAGCCSGGGGSVAPLFVAGGRGTRAAAGGHAGAVAAVAWYPVDAGMFVSAGADGAVKLWDANSVAPVATFSLGAGCRATAAAFSPTGAHALVAVGAGASGASPPGAPPAGASAPLRLLDAASGAFTHELVGHSGAVWAAAWALDDPHTLVSGGADGGVRVWDVRRATACVAVLDLDDTTTGRRGEGDGGGGDAPPPSSRLRRAPRRGPLRRAHDAAVTAVLPTPDGRHWVSAGADDAVRVWEMGSFARIPGAAASPLPNRARKPRQLAAAASPATLFAPSGSAVHVVPLPGGGLLRADGGGPRARSARPPAEPTTLLRGHVDAVHALAWCEARRELYSGGDDRQVLVWAPRARETGGGDAEERDRDAWSD